MRKSKFFLLIFYIILSKNFSAQSQENYVQENSASLIKPKLCSKAIQRSIKKSDRLTTRINKTTNSYLKRYERAEDGLLHKICDLDETHAESLLNTGLYAHRRLNNNLNRKIGEPLNQRVLEVEYLDKTASFLDENFSTDNQQCRCPGTQELKEAQQRLKIALKRSEIVREHIKDRVAYLEQLTYQYPQLKAVMPALKKPSYYLGAQTKEYLSLFANHSIAEKKLFGLLNQLPGFSDFGGAEGLLASPQQPPVDLSKIQTMDSVKEQFQAAADANGIKAPELLSNDKINELKKQGGQLKDLKDPPQEFAQAQLDNQMPGEVKELNETILDSIPKRNKRKEEQWKPNPLKTKRFVDRLTYGMNLQADPHTRFFPTTGSLAGQVSYKITTKMNIGIGASYLLAFGKIKRSDEINAPPFMSSGGYTLRSYYDYKIKGPLYAQINYELAYRHASQSMRAAMPFGDAKQAAMAGIKLKTSTSRKSQQTMEVLYDFRHRYTGQPAIVVRFGLEFLPKRAIR